MQGAGKGPAVYRKRPIRIRTIVICSRLGVEGETIAGKKEKITTAGIDAANIKPSWTGLVDGYMEEEVPSQNALLAGADGRTRVTPEEFSPLDGFIFDASLTFFGNSGFGICKGTVYDTSALRCNIGQKTGSYENVLVQLDKDGIQKYIEEMQRQLTAFKGKEIVTGKIPYSYNKTAN